MFKKKCSMRLPVHANAANERSVPRVQRDPLVLRISLIPLLPKIFKHLSSQRDMPFSDLLETALDALKNKAKDGEKLGAFWHYIKLFTVCVL